MLVDKTMEELSPEEQRIENLTQEEIYKEFPWYKGKGYCVVNGHVYGSFPCGMTPPVAHIGASGESGYARESGYEVPKVKPEVKRGVRKSKSRKQYPWNYSPNSKK
jgi:hypothetical protein